MEFGIFMNGYLPGPGAHNTGAEHLMIMREIEYAIHADAYNWKYLWFGEHHALTEYSHMSAPEVIIGYVAARTERIHMGTAIMNLSPRVNHPVRAAERAAMMDHLTGNRFEWGTGRGAGSHEIASFNILDKDSTKVEWEEVIKEIPRMWEQEDYEFHGDHFEVPYPHNILPKPYGKGHPPIWMACGNPPSFGRAGELGLGAIAFNFEPIHNLKGRCDAYKEAIANCTEPLGQFKNDNIMMTNAVICLEDRKRAREIALSAGRGYLNTMVSMYHDTMPKKEGAPIWPSPPYAIPNEDVLDQVIAGGNMLCGTPDEVAEQLAAYEAVGCDQVVFGFPPEGAEPDEIKEIIELFGTKVIPQFDTDPVHSTTRYREQAQPKYPRWNDPAKIDGLAVEVLPTTAIIPNG
ncbi:MAG TPA: LLM class flavin-dependent oxidoreductase [Microthrixaceae bacterium]|nr:LLM class flavin-dependent oxidoreductase [Microthrixaceae bacterium]